MFLVLNDFYKETSYYKNENSGVQITECTSDEQKQQFLCLLILQSFAFFRASLDGTVFFSQDIVFVTVKNPIKI